jgi:hypothetical protein
LLSPDTCAGATGFVLRLTDPAANTGNLRGASPAERNGAGESGGLGLAYG